MLIDILEADAIFGEGIGSDLNPHGQWGRSKNINVTDALDRGKLRLQNSLRDVKDPL